MKMNREDKIINIAGPIVLAILYSIVITVARWNEWESKYEWTVMCLVMPLAFLVVYYICLVFYIINNNQ